ncbi:hypothetical protein VTL71DRAFT_13044 [Oculimacula yallundae]|uniref:UDP-galactose transporter n=1 Tax=Oculimacula yallundae TaxID=86028 RepID=A0ABR4CRV6_9HELO
MTLPKHKPKPSPSLPRLPNLPSLPSYNLAYLSALSLVIIQVGIGCIMRSSQTGGSYTFSTSSSVTISEFFKFVISSVLMVRSAVRERRRDGTGRDGMGCHELVSQEDGGEVEMGMGDRKGESGSGNDDLDGGGGGAAGRGSGSGSGSERGDDERLIFVGDGEKGRASWSSGYGRMELFGAYVKSLRMVSVENRYGFAKLALLYALINNTIFVAYKLADPGTIALVRSGVIFITALIMVLALGADISKIQWTAIIIQLCGLATTQYTPDTGTNYPLSTYMVLLFQVFVSSVAGVYNQSLLKDENVSLHAQNAVLYGCGIVINGVVHLTLSFVTDDEPGFFVGYTNSAAYLVIVSNVFIGLAITAVYKYANAVIKCLATAVATGILLYISPILFGTTMAPLIIPGGLIVFITSWLYMECPAPKKPAVTFSDELPRKRPFNFVPSGAQWRNPILIISSVASIAIIVFCETMKLPEREIPIPREVLTSPMNNTLAFIRWNGHRPERIPLIEKYAPFFHTLHFSMPGQIESPHRTAFENMTHDNWGDGLVTYVQIARTMQLILETPRNESGPEIGGLLQFHFDVWIDPMDFAEEDYTKMWIAVSRHNDNAGGGPTFLCMKKRERFDTWVGMAKDRNWQYPLLAALSDLEKANTDFTFDPEEWCTGWSDIYYIPRHLWVDYIYLAAFFGARAVFHEMAVPTIMHIIDQSRRRRELSSIISYIGDCYGGCCAGGGNIDDVISHRCGHKLDYAGDPQVVKIHYDGLDYAASMLGSEIERPQWLDQTHHRQNWTTFTEALAPEAITAWKTASNKTPLDKTMGHNMPENFRWNSTGLEPPPTPAELWKIEQETRKKEQLEKAKIANEIAEAQAKEQAVAFEKAQEQRLKEKLQLAEQVKAEAAKAGTPIVVSENET